MRIDGKIEKTTGAAILLIHDAPAKSPDWIAVYSAKEQHSEAQRAYTRTHCRNPKTYAEAQAVLSLMSEWCRLGA